MFSQRYPNYLLNRSDLVIILKNIIKERENCVSKNKIKKYDLLDTKFHKTFFLLSANRYLLKHYENINGIIETLRTHTHKDTNCTIFYPF